MKVAEGVVVVSSSSTGFRLFREVVGRWRLLLASSIVVVIYAYTVSYSPVLIRFAIDRGVSVGDLGAAVSYSLMLVGLVALGGLTWYATRYLTAVLSQKIAHDLRVRAFESVHRQSMDFFDKVAAGQLISRITNDTNRLARSLSWQVRNIVNLSLTAAISLYFMLTMNINLSLIALGAMVLMAAVNTKYTLTIRPLYNKIRNQLGIIASVVTSNLNGIRTVKALSLEDSEADRFSVGNKEFLNLNLKAAKVRAIYGNSSQLVLGVSLAAVLYYGALLIINNGLSVGELTAFITYLSLMMWPMRALGFTISSIQRALAAAARVFEIIDWRPSVSFSGEQSLPAEFRGEIEFRDVAFSYIPGKPVLKGISFHIRPGENVLLVGPPGSGKSTILKLIIRFYDFSEGKILIDGKDIRKLNPQSLREHIAYVPQEPFIFSGSIKDNIAFGNPKASKEDIIRAAKIAKIHDFITTLPQGYDSIVGERGITLSGGQRQRIAIARAILKNPEIVLLDDPVSNLDAETEAKLVEDLKDILKGKKSLIVSQRVSLAKLADRVIVMDKGRIVEEGVEKELISRKGLYYKLYVASVKGGE